MQDINPIIWIIVAAVVIVVLLVWFMNARRRTAHLRDRFGDEYDRTVGDVGKTSAAEAALIEREKRVEALQIRPLTAQEHAGYATEWRDTKALFVDSPAETVLRADRLLASVMKTRGYPMADFARRHEDLTVTHADVARHYLAGHEMAERQTRGEASTEDLRQAMVHYEALFDALVEDADRDGDSASTVGVTSRTDAAVERQPMPVDRDTTASTPVSRHLGDPT